MGRVVELIASCCVDHNARGRGEREGSTLAMPLTQAWDDLRRWIHLTLWRRCAALWLLRLGHDEKDQTSKERRQHERDDGDAGETLHDTQSSCRRMSNKPTNRPAHATGLG